MSGTSGTLRLWAAACGQAVAHFFVSTAEAGAPVRTQAYQANRD